jgi:hypothetical protein
VTQPLGGAKRASGDRRRGAYSPGRSNLKAVKRGERDKSSARIRQLVGWQFLAAVLSLDLLGPQPFEHSPSRFQVFLVVGKDFGHQLLPLSFIAGFSCLDERCHRPLTAILGFLALEPNIILNDLETETRQGQDDRVSCYRKKV